VVPARSSARGRSADAGLARGYPRTMHPLGMLIVFLVTAATPSAPSVQRAFEYRCTGLGAYEIRGTYDVDWSWGNIRSRSDRFVVGFEVGPMLAPSVPRQRPPGFRSYTVEHLGRATLRYGVNGKSNQLQATVEDAPVSDLINLSGRAQNAQRFLSVARTLATAKCKSIFERR
jgi:hypothetical protein